MRGHCRAKWDLTLDKQARPQATAAYGCEGGEEAEEERGQGGRQAVHSASHETPSCHNRHLPALTLNTHQGEGGCILPLSNRRMEKRKDGGKREVISSSCCCDVWGMLGSGPDTVLRHFWSRAANLLIIAAKGWRCDLNGYFKSGADLWEPLHRERTGRRSRTSSSHDRHTTKHTAAVQASRGQTVRRLKSCKTTAGQSSGWTTGLPLYWTALANVTEAKRGITQMKFCTSKLSASVWDTLDKCRISVIFVSSNNNAETISQLIEQLVNPCGNNPF